MSAASSETGSEEVAWVRGEVEPCVLCETPVYLGFEEGVDLARGHGVGHPMMETYQHYECPNGPLQARVAALADRLYLSESVCWALYRIEQVGDASVDADADQDHLRTRWAAWKATTLSGRDVAQS